MKRNSELNIHIGIPVQVELDLVIRTILHLTTGQQGAPPHGTALKLNLTYSYSTAYNNPLL